MAQSKLFKTRRFLPLFVAQFFGAFNDNFLKTALVILITYKTREIFGIPSAQMVAVTLGIFILPFFLFSAQAGQLADKFDKARLTRYVKLAEIAIMVVAAVGFLQTNFVLLLASLFLMGVHSTLFGPIKYGILPQHLENDEIVGGNALIEAGTFLAILFGTVLGGILMALEQGALAVSAGLLACAIIGYLASRAIPDAEPPAPDLKVRWNPITPTIQMLRYSAETPAVMRSILGISWFWLLGANLISVFPSYGKDQLHAEEHLVTVFLAIFSLGIGIGSMMCEKLSRRHLELGLVPLGSIGMTLFSVDLFIVGIPPVFADATVPVTIGQFFSQPSGIRIAIDLLLFSIFSGFYIVPLYALIQLRSNPQHRSRIIAANNILNALFMVLGSGLLVLLLRAQLNVPQIILVLAILNAAVALYIYLLIPEFLLRFIVWCLANVIYRMKVRGGENIPKNGPAIVIANHVSFVDWLILAAAIGRPARFIMHHSFNKGPMKILVKHGKVIPIASAKENAALMEEAFRRAHEELNQGELVCLFPEGKITDDGNLNPFRPGILRLLESNPVPVVPGAICNMWGSYFSRSEGRALLKRPRRFWTRIQVRFGAPVPAAEVTLPKLEDQVKQLLS